LPVDERRDTIATANRPLPTDIREKIFFQVRSLNHPTSCEAAEFAIISSKE